MALQRIEYRPDQRPDVEVLVGGVWCAGEIRVQTQHDDGTWVIDAQYRLPGQHSSRIGDFTPAAVRADQVDRSRGRAHPVEDASSSAADQSP